MKSRTGPVTMKQIADATGLSRPTVSMALSNKGTLSELTRAKVLKAAQELGYRPNAGARALHEGQFGMIGLLLSTDQHRSNLPQDLLSGIEEELSAHDIHVTVARFTDSKLVDGETLPRVLREWMCEGLLINYNAGVPPQLGRLIAKHRIPATWINARLPSDCVYPDERAAGRLAVEELIRLGHRRIAYIDTHYYAGWAYGRMHFSTEERMQGYTDAMKAARLKPFYFLPPKPKADTDPNDDFVALCDTMVEQLARALRGPEPVTALINYLANESVPWEAAARAGLSIPHDLSIVSFGAKLLGRESLLVVPQREVGMEAARMILRKLENPSQSQPAIKVPFTLSTKPSSIMPPSR